MVVVFKEFKSLLAKKNTHSNLLDDDQNFREVKKEIIKAFQNSRSKKNHKS